VRFLDGWATAHYFAKESAEARRTKLLAQLESELMRWGEYEKPTNDPSAPPRVFISGRVAEDGTRENGARDDLAFAACFSIWLCRLIVKRIAPGVEYEKIFGLPMLNPSGTKKRRRSER